VYIAPSFLVGSRVFDCLKGQKKKAKVEIRSNYLEIRDVLTQHLLKIIDAFKKQIALCKTKNSILCFASLLLK
jgi:hypothetical protein